MKLDLSEIARNLGMRFHYEIDEPPIEDETVACADRIRGHIDFANTGLAIITKGAFETAVKLECSRCLTTFIIPVSSEIDEQFEIPNPAEMIDEEEIVETEEEQELEPFFVENVLDITELIRQSLILNAPIRPLCDEACKGLCPACGKNLNEGPCECEVKTDSSPFASLAEMWKESHNNAEEE
ncbi:MAG: DUF177 domain-containing protein [Armatimonadota bacterium]|nr:DUF177 domain-containing protein [Armatimonadota bacterium]